jgi:Eukaryotic elongation factor 5A hypusine, DNA-binding OB fold
MRSKETATMSGLEDRCIQFHEAAMGTGKSKGPAKEIATLRKFLHKNQTQRFTDKATSRLFDTIQIYCTGGATKKADVAAAGQWISVALEDREGLLEDALKMPFTVFATKQKKAMLKWIEDLRGERDKNGGTATPKSTTTKLSVIDLDIDQQKLSLMKVDSGETYEDVLLPAGDVGLQIQKAFEASDDAVDVEATVDDDGKVKVLRVCV